MRRRGYGGYGAGAGVSASLPEQQQLDAIADRARQEQVERQEAYAAADLRRLEMEEMHERLLLKKLREGATADEIAHQEELLQLYRDYAYARATLEDQALKTEIARLDRRREEIEKRAEEEETINQQIARRSADAITEAIREETSIKGAMKGLLNELLRKCSTRKS